MNFLTHFVEFRFWYISKCNCDAVFLPSHIACSTTGNHEEYTGEAQLWGEFVAERGFTVLKVGAPFIDSPTAVVQAGRHI